MKDIFANLYNKVVSFFHQTDEKSANAKDVACNRLKLVLMQDRTNLTPAIMDRMRKELIELLSKYMELDRELLDLSFEHEDEQMALMLSIPVVRAKNEDEINEILAKEDEERKKLEELMNPDGVKEEDSDEDDNEEDSSEENEDSDSDKKTEDTEENADDSEENSDDNPEEEKKPELSDKEKAFSDEPDEENEDEADDEADDEEDEVDEEIDNDPTKTKKEKKKEKFFKKKKESEN